MKPNVLDMYHGDNNERVPDFAALKQGGIIAIIHKASQGSHSRDPKYAARRDAAKTAGLLWGAYHFGDASAVASQITNFTEAASLVSGEDLAVLDYEPNPGAGGTMTIHQAAAYLMQIGHLRPWIYSSNLIRETLPHVTPTERPYIVRCPLWLAQYGIAERIPTPWDATTCPLWQYSESGNVIGMTGHVDLNIFYGSADQLRSIWGKLTIGG